MMDDIFMKPNTFEEYNLKKPVFIEPVKLEYIDGYRSFDDFKTHVNFLETRDTAKRTPLLMEKIKKLSTDVNALQRDSRGSYQVDISVLPTLKDRLKKIHQEYLEVKGNRYNPLRGGKKSRRRCSKSKKSKKRRKCSKKTKRRRSKR
jgi:hypothetical protein